MMKFQHAKELFRYYSSFLSYDLARIISTGQQKLSRPSMEHVRAGVQWLCRAQDVSNNGGVARSYSFIYNPYFKKKGWTSAYPETTGYIISTMFDYANLVKRRDIYDRAIRMADWECDVQLINGAVQGGTIDQAPSPAVFNTGQVIFGWLRTFQETQNRRYLECAIKAGSFLIKQQDKNGTWQKHLSDFASSQLKFYTYNTRTAWGLLELSNVSGDPAFKDAAIRNIDFALEQQLENGWFKSNCLNDPSQPLLHTIAYCIRGILEVGILLKNDDYINRARNAADHLLETQRPDGSLAGRFNEQWMPTVSWSCLTGNAQIAIIWGRLHEITGEHQYLNGLSRANAFLRRVQILQTNNPDLYGGLCGSYPIHGHYGRFEILNWTVKFFVDSLMTEKRIQTTP